MRFKTKLMFIIGLIAVCIGCSGLKAANTNQVQKCPAFSAPECFGQLSGGE